MNKRTASSFSNQLHKKHHTGTSPLAELKFQMVTKFPLDYMHLVCLGVMKKLLKAWMKGPNRISVTGRRIINQNISNCSKFIPREFNRKPRPLNFISFFKATELRFFLLYGGITFFRNAMPFDKYRHFLKLHCAMFILLSESAKDQGWNTRAGQLLKEFVDESELLYGKEFMVYNIHSLSHLADDAGRFGSLETISAFPFENEIQQLLKYFRGKNNLHLQQVVNRIKERNENAGMVRRTDAKKICSPSSVSSIRGNNCFRFDDGSIIIVTQVVSENEIRYRICECKKLKHYPIRSTSLSIYRVTGYSKVYQSNADKLIHKCVLLPDLQHGEGQINLVCIPFVNDFSLGVPLN